MAWSRDPRTPTRYMRGSKRYNDVGGHSPPGDELENTRDHERIWFELVRKRTCCGCEDPGLRYCFESADYANRICNEYAPVNAVLIDYFPGSGGVDGGWYLESKCPAGRRTQSEVGGSPVTFFPDGSWRNGPMFSHDGFGNNGRFVAGALWYWSDLFPNVDWSFEFFLKPGQSDIDGANGITSFGYFAGAATNGIATSFGVGGKITLNAPRATNGTSFASPAGTLVAEEWHHVVYVRRTEDASFSIYVNGKRVIYAKIPTSGFSASSTDQFTFAASQYSQWSDIARYNGALTARDIVKTTNLLIGAIGDDGTGTGDGNGGVVIEDPGDVIQSLDPSRIDGGGLPTAILTSGGEDAYWELPIDTPFELEVRKGAADGYAALDANTRVPDAQLGAGAASVDVFLRGDRIWAAVPATPPELPQDAIIGDLARLGGDPYFDDLMIAAAPLVYWKFQESAGAALADDAVGGNDLTPSGSVVFGNTPGPVTQETKYVDLGSATGKLSRPVFTNLTTNWTIEFWFRLDNIPPANQRNVFKYGTNANVGFHLWVNANQKLQGICQGVNILGASVATLSLDTWYHVAIVRDTTTFKLYINGVLDSTLGTSAMNAPTGNFEIGGNPNANDDYHYAHFAFHSRVVPVAELLQRYNAYDAVGSQWVATSLDELLPKVALTKSADQTITTATLTAVTFDTEVADTAAFHEGVTNPSRITIPTGQDGKYLVTGSVCFAPNATGLRSLTLVKNGVGSVTPATKLAAALAPGDATLGTPLSVSAEVSLAAGDYIELAVYQTSGGNLDVDKDQMVAHFGAVRIGD